jgi:methionyl aminopeptidase
MINYYSPSEIELIRQSGKITANALKQIIPKAIPGVSTLDLDQQVEQSIVSSGGEPSFKMEKGYRWATCMCVNDCVVHGIPTDYKLQNGDRLGIDLGTFYRGFHSDASWTVIVGKNHDPEITRFLDTGEKTLKLAVAQAVAGNHVGHISKTIQDNVESANYSCVKQLVGHGVGKQLHEDPEVPCYLRGKIENTVEIKVGMVLAVEIIYNMGKSEVVYAGDDGWTIVTRDGSLSGLFEQTVAITENGPEILTK